MRTSASAGQGAKSSDEAARSIQGQHLAEGSVVREGADQCQAEQIRFEELFRKLVDLLRGDGLDLGGDLLRGQDLAVDELLAADPTRHRPAVLESHEQAT